MRPMTMQERRENETFLEAQKQLDIERSKVARQLYADFWQNKLKRGKKAYAIKRKVKQ